MPVALDPIAFFDAGAGADVTESGWRAAFSAIIPACVCEGIGDDFDGAVVSGQLAFDISPGAAWVAGHYAERSVADGDYRLTVATNPSLAVRWDIAVLRADYVANTVTLDIVQGTVNGVKPALTQDATKYEMALWALQVPQSATELSALANADFRLLRSAKGGATKVRNDVALEEMESLGYVPAPAVGDIFWDVVDGNFIYYNGSDYAIL